MLIIFDPVFSEGTNILSNSLHLCEVGADVVIPQIDGNILHLPLFGLVIDDQLGIHNLKQHHEEGQYTRDLSPRAVISVYELALFGMKGVLACPVDMILQDEMEGSTNMLAVDLVSIQEAEVSVLVCVDGVNLHVGGLGEGGRFIAHRSY